MMVEESSTFGTAIRAPLAFTFAVAVMSVLASSQTIAKDPVTGGNLARDLCSGCHLVAPDQDGPVSDGVPAFPELAQDAAMTDTRLRGFIVDPHPPMPQVQLTSVEIEAIVAYIRGLSSR